MGGEGRGEGDAVCVASSALQSLRQGLMVSLGSDGSHCGSETSVVQGRSRNPASSLCSGVVGISLGEVNPI